MLISTKKLMNRTVLVSSLAHKNELWLWDITADSLVAIGSLDDNYRWPVVSPDGNTVAVLAGSGYGDACVVDLRLIFLKIDTESSCRYLFKVNTRISDTKFV